MICSLGAYLFANHSGSSLSSIFSGIKSFVYSFGIILEIEENELYTQIRIVL